MMDVFMDAVTQSFESRVRILNGSVFVMKYLIDFCGVWFYYSFEQGSQSSDHLQKWFEKCKGKYREAIGRVLEKIFEKEYPEDVPEITIEGLLKWELWPISIKIYSEFWWLIV